MWLARLGALGEALVERVNPLRHALEALRDQAQPDSRKRQFRRTDDGRSCRRAYASCCGSLSSWSRWFLPSLVTKRTPALALAVVALVSMHSDTGMALSRQHSASATLPSASPLRTWVPNGPDAVVPFGDRIYLGGNFNRLAPPTGTGVVYNVHRGSIETRWPEVAGGDVAAVAGDGRGGWFIGGSFRYVGGLVRRGLAHILATRTIDRSWDAHLNGRVVGVARSGRILYIAGDFTRVNGEPRNGVAALYAARGGATPWRPRGFARSTELDTLAVVGSTVFVGGVAGTRLVVLSIDSRSGRTIRVLRIPARAERGEPSVSRIVPRRGRLFISGYFTALDAKPRAGIAAVDSRIGSVTAWDPAPDSAYADLLAVAGDVVYIGGVFHRIGGANRFGIAAVNVRSARATSWRPRLDGPVVAADRVRNVVYLCGGFSEVGGASRNGLAAVGAHTGAVLPWHPDGPASDWGDSLHASLAVQGSRIFVGGNFTGVGGVSRTGLGAIDTRTHAATPWAPTLTDNGEAGVAGGLAAANGRLYVSGVFDHVDGKPRAGVAAFDATTGTLLDWAPRPDDDVYTFAYVNGAVFLGGNFNRIDGQPRSGLAAVDALTGTLLPLRVDVDGFVDALLATPTRLFLGGRFDSVGGVRCRNLATIDLATNRVLPDWCPQPDGDVNALALSRSSLYVVGEFGRVAGRPYESAAALDPESGAALPWNPMVLCPCANDVTVDESTVYLAGLFDRVNGRPRFGLAAFDATTGVLLPWAPKLDGSADTIAVDNAAVYVGGSFGSVNRVAQSNFATFPTRAP
jgi:hypothetical protein